ncbi:MAG TPA: prenyltransferase [Longilinea sp.]|nr:prenyltransferase [Longilinea sp.]
MNVGMWWKALRVIPRIDKAEWQRLDVVARWLISTRAAVLLMTFFSAALAGLFALRDGQFNAGRWALLALGLVFAHATNNLVNDFTDYKRGVDKDNYFRTQYGPQPIEQGLMTQREMFAYIAFSAVIAIAAGIPLVIFGGTTALLLMAAGAVFVLFYTWPLKYIGLGEISVVLIWGPLMVGGGYFVITGAWNWNVTLASLAYALGPTTVLFGKHIDKLASDQAKKIRTLPVILGEKAARYAVMGMIIAMYAVVVYLVITGFFSPFLLIVLLALHTLPRVWAMYRNPKPAERPADYDPNAWPLWFSAMSFYHNRQFGALLILGLILEIIIL